MSNGSPTVYVDAPARLHFGVLDLRGSLGRWFGGIGAAAPAPTAVISAALLDSETFDCTGDDWQRAETFARRFCEFHDLRQGARIRVHRALPPHAGLGSGTQMALAVARALAELHGIDTDVTHLARAVDRTRRSAVGTWAFAGGGFILEGGRLRDRDSPAPLLARIPFPETWRCIVAVPETAAGVSGPAELSAFATLPVPDPGDAERVSHCVLMALLPALVEGDLESFGAALTAIQEITGRWFAAAQGGVFASGQTAALVRQLKAWGVHGVGQSSWGPTVYGIVAGPVESAAIAARVRDVFEGRGAVYEGPFRATGALVQYAPLSD